MSFYEDALNRAENIIMEFSLQNDRLENENFMLWLFVQRIAELKGKKIDGKAIVERAILMIEDLQEVRQANSYAEHLKSPQGMFQDRCTNEQEKVLPE